MLTSEVHGQLPGLAGRPAAVALPAALGWVREAPAVATALTGAARAVARDGLLLFRPVESRRANSRRSNLRWLPVTSPEDLQRHPQLTELRATRDALAGRPRRCGTARRAQHPPRPTVRRRRGPAGASDAAS
jgi:hypothetical protein